MKPFVFREVTDAPNVQAYQNDSPRGTETNDVSEYSEYIYVGNEFYLPNKIMFFGF